MATFTLQFSCHGIALDVNNQPVGTFILPNNTTVYYFVREGGVLDYNVSIDIYNELVNNELDRIQPKIEETKSFGAAVKNYSLWDLKDQKFVSGSLRVGENTPIINIDGTTYNNPTNFRDLFYQTLGALNKQEGDSVIIYFNACREG